MIGLCLLVLGGASAIVGVVAWGNRRSGRAPIHVPPPPSNVKLIRRDEGL